MDRIVQALERTKREQGRREPVLVERPLESAAEPARAEPEIVYTHTRSIPVSKELLRRRRVITGIDDRAVEDAYKILCTQVLQRTRDKGFNALAVVSPGPGEGKTLTAINLAISLSGEIGQTVLLVDADLRHPSVHEYFGLGTVPGLTEHLLDQVRLETILINPGIKDFVLLPGGRPLRNSAEMLSSPKMHALVREVKSRYPSRIIVFDLPPVLTVADAIAFAPHVDATLMVVQEEKTGADDLSRAVEMLESTNLIGTVLNNARSGAPAEGTTRARAQTTKRGWLSRLTRRG
jgi:exopolysaccharide/PEP-CTERM locus tyrosine autokinase